MPKFLELMQRSVRVNGVSLTYFERSGDNERPVLLVHATGMHARVWDSTIESLRRTQRVIALEMRGHGRSDKTGPFTWRQFGRDVSAFCKALDLKDVVAVGHSMGGHSVVRSCAEDPARFCALVLVDPVIRSPDQYIQQHNAIASPKLSDHPISKRREIWSSPEEMFNRFRDRHPFCLWRPHILYSYCVHGLESIGNSRFRLQCPPEIEAQIYMNSAEDPIHSHFHKVHQPVTVLRAAPRDTETRRFDFSMSPTYPALAAQFRQGRDIFLPKLSHFIPMQEPGTVAQYINEADPIRV